MPINFIEDSDGVMVPQFEFEVKKTKIKLKKFLFFWKSYKKIRLFLKRVSAFGWNYKKVLSESFVSAADWDRKAPVKR